MSSRQQSPNTHYDDHSILNRNSERAAKRHRKILHRSHKARYSSYHSSWRCEAYFGSNLWETHGVLKFSLKMSFVTQ
ncbi:uncharacterized protein LACBIDRAFT_307773 [Laccaria bicolor S238N-H82]|uniref:Predicted protein n=1 Tax=Laccaria bicolor (strain S238N-H82 / ATCC MYA-4686) TaxID=486041 RepID=B0DR05_LACBS|nr:uncharacterized protein LACBIDRAFT_307773 [Laccaria bicolor S238N-H82]EDR02914.1 predicted protein [Laccaria bicolor S238N-H82]|eukprot:XP_001886337.1 predicted protein [Laccaria bicolor S238N-H82]